MTDAENVYDEAGLKSALTSIEAARVAQTPGSITDTCLLITLGLLQMRMNHPELAIVSLTQAYRISNSPEMIDQKVIAAGPLSSVMALLGDFEQALALNQELIDWATAHDATLSLSISKFLRGKIFMSMGNFEAARESFNEARKLSVQIEDLQGVAFADLNLCEAQIARGQLEPARALCDSALRAFTGTKSTDVMKEAQSLLARVELDEGHADRALNILNVVLDQHGADMYGRRVTFAYEWRARANAALGKDHDAYADLAEYVRRYKESGDAARQLNTTALRVKFEIALKAQELEQARAEALAARLEVSRQALLRNLVVVSAALLVSTAFFATWLWRRRHAAEGIRQAAQERFAAIGRLTGGVAHEFNNLLTVIQNAVGLLARRVVTKADTTASDLVVEIQQATKFCADITTQLLSFAQQQNLNPESISMDEFLVGILPTLEKLAGPTVSVQIDRAQPSSVVQADRRQLTATLLNLVANARDAMDKCGTITIGAVGDTAHWVRIDVKDDGCGMAADVLAHAAEPFYSTKAVGAGSGLGLSMVDGFVRQSGGTMTITSTPQRGTTISLQLPRAEATS